MFWRESGQKPMIRKPARGAQIGSKMESKAELVTAALLAKGINPADTKEWAREYREHSRFSRDVLIDVIASYRKKRRS